jgi:hypothetical protein
MAGPVVEGVAEARLGLDRLGDELEVVDVAFRCQGSVEQPDARLSEGPD